MPNADRRFTINDVLSQTPRFPIAPPTPDSHPLGSLRLLRPNPEVLDAFGPAVQLAIEEWTLDELDAGRVSEGMRFWEWTEPAVVLGRHSKIDREVNRSVCRADGVPIYRRHSGGGVVLLGPGCLAYSFFLKQDPERNLHRIDTAIRSVMTAVAAAIGRRIEGITLSGISDLVWNGRKISGNAQRWTRTHLLHHGTLLCGMDPELIERYLRSPLRQPDYRDDRSHREFVTNLPIDADTLKPLLRDHLTAGETPLDPDPDRLRELIDTRYENPAWTDRI